MPDTINQETGEVARPQMPPAIAKAIIKVMSGVRQLGVDERNQHGGYNFVSTDKFYAALGPKMAEAGLMIMADELEHEVRTAEGQKTGWLHVRYAITLAHESGALWGPFNRACIVVASGPQAFASAQSFILKYFLRALFLVPTGEKDEVDSQEKVDLPTAPARRMTATEIRALQADPAPPVPAKPNGAAPVAPKPAENPAVKAAWNRLRGELAAAQTEEEVDHVIRNGNPDMKLVEENTQTGIEKIMEAAAARREKVRATAPAGEMPI